MALPEWFEPMAATLTQERFTGPEWTFERKYDGIRLLAFKRGKAVTLYSRNHIAQDVPAVAAAVAGLPAHQLVLDGELDWDRGAYHVFDILWRDARDLRGLTVDERRAELATLPLHAPLARVEALTGDELPWERARREGWEGVIAKRRLAPYQHKRSRDWLKMKIEASQELVVGGFTDPEGKRVGLGALLVGYYDGDVLVFAGKVGTGLDSRGLLAMRARLDALARATPPFARGSGLPRRAHWCEPEVVVQVGFMEWTAHGKLRHPRLIGIRDDKRARDVTRDAAP